MNRSRPFSKWGAYTESDNAPARNRVWPRETTSSHDFVASACFIGSWTICAFSKWYVNCDEKLPTYLHSLTQATAVQPIYIATISSSVIAIFDIAPS